MAPYAQNKKEILDFKSYKYLMQAQRRIYFVGIGGISMCGLAELAKSRGQLVAGSDRSYNDRCAYLESLDIKIYKGHSADHIRDFQPDAVVYTAAIPKDNPELLFAREQGLPTLERSDWLGLLNREFGQVINVAGTNGKSTTTAMTAYILLDAGLDATVHLGAELDRFKSTVHVGSADLLLSEACEFNYSFYSFASTITAILNLDHDHVDLFPKMEDVIRAFATYLCLQAPGTKVVLPSFDPHITKLLAMVEEIQPGQLDQLDFYYYGYEGEQIEQGKPDMVIGEISYQQGLPHFSLSYRGQDLGQFVLSIPARFNVENAAAAVLLAHLAGANFEFAKKSLRSFRGAEGRFTICGTYNGALVVNDYAHHPDSVKLTVAAAKEMGYKRLIPCFQAISFSRAKGLAEGFVQALREEPGTVILEVYDDREKDRSFSARAIADKINEAGGKALFMSNPEELESYLRKELMPGDLVLLMGQNIRQVGDRLTARTDHYSKHLSLADELKES